MKYSEKLIQDYRYWINDFDETERGDYGSYFYSKFDMNEFYDELFDVGDNIEKLTLIDFMIFSIDKDIEDVEIKTEMLRQDNLEMLNKSIREYGTKSERKEEITERKNFLKELYNIRLRFKSKYNEIEKLIKNKSNIEQLNTKEPKQGKAEKKETSKNTKAKHRIKWLLGDTDLIEFFKILKDENIISNDTLKDFKVIARDCFIRENDTDFDNQSLAKLDNQRTGESKKAHKIIKAVDKIKKKH